MACKNLGSIHAKGTHETVYHCFGGQQVCTLEQSPLKLLNGSPMQFCGPHCPGVPTRANRFGGDHMPHYGRFLREAIDSALSQTLRPNQIVVVDDASSDDTWQVFDSYVSNMTNAYDGTDDDRIRYIGPYGLPLSYLRV